MKKFFIRAFGAVLWPFSFGQSFGAVRSRSAFVRSPEAFVKVVHRMLLGFNRLALRVHGRACACVRSYIYAGAGLSERARGRVLGVPK